MPIKTESGHHQTKVDFPTTQPAGADLLTCIPDHEEQQIPTNNFHFENLNDGGAFSQSNDGNEPLSQFWCFRDATTMSPQHLPPSQTLLFHNHQQQQQLQETEEHYTLQLNQTEPTEPSQCLLPIALSSNEQTNYANNLVLGKYANSDYSWDIKDIMLPEINSFDSYELWPEGNCRRVYSITSERARRHQSGWAMRNTNNHNPQVLKKSCLGVLVCSTNCRSNGQPVAYRPAICDKARKKQCMRSCTTAGCNGHLVQKHCKGHGGYPVTHFWRFANGAVFFQGKGRHDHVRPMLKALGEREVKGGGIRCHSPSNRPSRSPDYQSAFSEVDTSKGGHRKLLPTTNNVKITSAFRHDYSTRSSRDLAKAINHAETAFHQSSLLQKHTIETLPSAILADVKDDVYPLSQSQGQGEFMDSTRTFYENSQNNERPLEDLDVSWNPRFHVGEQLSFTTTQFDINHQEQLETPNEDHAFQNLHIEPFQSKSIVRIIPAPQEQFISQQREQYYPWRLPAFSRLANSQFDDQDVSANVPSTYCPNESGEICSSFSEINNRGFAGDTALRVLEKNVDQPFLGMLFSTVDPNQLQEREREEDCISDPYSSTDVSLLQQLGSMDHSINSSFVKKDMQQTNYQQQQQEQQPIAYNIAPMNNQLPPPTFYSESAHQQSEGHLPNTGHESSWTMTSSQQEEMKSWFPFVNASSWKPVETG